MTTMRQLCLSKYTVVLQGKEWCSSVPPSSKQASTLLENNESVVSWLSPKEKNTETEHQIPAILFQGAYWTLSLRMSKSIYRHVRLSQDFQNVQRLHGVQTLRIPRHLLREKQRTQARFEVYAVPIGPGVGVYFSFDVKFGQKTLIGSHLQVFLTGVGVQSS